MQKEIKAGIQKVVDMLVQINTHLALPDAPSSPVPRRRFDQDRRSPSLEQREPEKKKGASGKRRERSESPADADAAPKEAEKEKTKKKKKKKNKV